MRQLSRLTTAAADRVEHLEGGDMLGHVVHAEDFGAARSGGQIGRDGADQAALHVGVDQRAEEGLSRYAHQKREAVIRKILQAGNGVAVLTRGLAEADAGIEDDATLWNAGLPGERERSIEERA